MRVQKRNNRGYEEVKFDKITMRISHLCTGLSPKVSPQAVAQKTISGLHDGISTEELDQISARAAESLKHVHVDYGKLASNIVVSNLHKMTPGSFSESIAHIKASTDIISPPHYEFIMTHRDNLDGMIIDGNDYLFDYFGFKTLESNYLNRVDETVLTPEGTPTYLLDGVPVSADQVIFENCKPYVRVATPTILLDGVLCDDRGIPVSDANDNTQLCPVMIKTRQRVVDRPQYMFMRVAIAIWLPRNGIDVEDANVYKPLLERIKHSYKLMSQLYFTHATPTLFNACMRQQQLNSCFLLGTGDSQDEIMRTVTNASKISKSAGGIGIHMSNIRGANSVIKTTNGRSSGLPKQLKIYNEAACTWDQGGRRKGAFAIYIEPWHKDILNVLRMKLTHGDESERARDLFYALWIPDLFTFCVNNGLSWSLFSEDTAPGLSDVFDGMLVCSVCNYCANPAYKKYFGDVSCDCLQHEFERVKAFTQLYVRYERAGKAVGKIAASEIMEAVIKLQRESGVPYVCQKDVVNKMSNQAGIGTIKSSNLCTEIMEYSDKDSYASCTLASINLSKFVRDNMINHARLHEIVQLIIRHLDKVIDNNDYPVVECINNARDYRPIGLGVQGLANVFTALRIPFLSDRAAAIDNEIFETIYHAAVTASCDLADEFGSFVGFENSPAARGILAPDLAEECMGRTVKYSGRYNFDLLRKRVTTGMRNSLLIAQMPTVSTSPILGNNESIEPFHANIYVKTTLGGKFTVINTDMVTHLQEIGAYSDNIRMRIMNDRGSVAGITEIPKDVRDIYATVWEMKQTMLMERAAARQVWIDQAQSLNIYLADNSAKNLRGVYNVGTSLKLKTVSYYIRTRPAADPQKTNIAVMAAVQDTTDDNATCTMEEGCVMCSS